MSMKTSTRQVDGVTIVDCGGRITLGEGSVILRDTVRELLSKGQKKMLLNLGEVTYIDSSGIGELVSAFTTVRNQGGELKLLNLTKIPDPLAPENLLKTSGRGIFLIRSFMDEVQIHPSQTGTEIKLVKHVHGPSEGVKEASQ